MRAIIPEMLPLFDYRPVEMLDKLETLLKNEFDRISHYDLMAYSEMCKDMLKINAATHVVSTDKQPVAQTAAGPIEESKAGEVQADDDMDPALAAMMVKKSKKGKKSGKPEPKKSAAPAKSAVAEVVEVTKEERNA